MSFSYWFRFQSATPTATKFMMITNNGGPLFTYKRSNNDIIVQIYTQPDLTFTNFYSNVFSTNAWILFSGSIAWNGKDNNALICLHIYNEKNGNRDSNC